MNNSVLTFFGDICFLDPAAKDRDSVRAFQAERFDGYITKPFKLSFAATSGNTGKGSLMIAYSESSAPAVTLPFTQQDFELINRAIELNDPILFECTLGFSSSRPAEIRVLDLTPSGLQDLRDCIARLDVQKTNPNLPNLNSNIFNQALRAVGQAGGPRVV